MGTRSVDKLNAIAGIAALSAIVATLLILSNLEAILPLASGIFAQLYPESIQADAILSQLSEFKVPTLNASEGYVLLAISGFTALSLSSTVAAAKMNK